MSEKSETIEVQVDGVTYWVSPLNPFEAIRLDFLCARVGAGIIKTAVASKDTKEFLQTLFKGEGAIENMLDSEILPLVIGTLSDTFDEILSRVDYKDVVEAIELAVIGHVECPLYHAERVVLADQSTYFSAIGPRMRLHGDAHQLRLLWEVIKVNLGPTIAGVSTALRRDAGERQG